MLIHGHMGERPTRLERASDVQRAALLKAAVEPERHAPAAVFISTQATIADS